MTKGYKSIWQIFSVALLRYNLYTIKFTHFKYKQANDFNEFITVQTILSQSLHVSMSHQ